MHPLLRLAVATTFVFSLAPPALAQAWPAKPMRLIVNSPPGASVDLIARTFAPRLASALGQPVVVDNRGGGGGAIGVSAVAKSSPDGYTLLHSAGSLFVFGPHVKGLDFDIVRDLEPIVTTARNTVLVVSRSGLAAGSLAELIALARANPGKLNFGSGSYGLHAATEMMLRAAKVQANHVPYKGVAQMLTDLIAGHIDFALDPGTAIPHGKAGKLRILAVASSARSSSLPDIPTTAEAGTDVDVGAIAVIGMYGPAGLPRDIVSRLQNETGRIMQTPESRASLGRIGSDVLNISASEFAAALSRDRERYGILIREANIRIE